MMANNLSLFLELIERTNTYLRFRVAFQSHAPTKLFFPSPNITSLRFWSAANGQEAQGYTAGLLSSSGGGFTLDPGSAQAFHWRVRPRNVGEPTRPEEVDDEGFDYWRWSVDIGFGEYQVQYHFAVQRDYFDPDSHMRLPQLERIAQAQEAALWLGQAESNSLIVISDGRDA